MLSGSRASSPVVLSTTIGFGSVGDGGLTVGFSEDVGDGTGLSVIKRKTPPKRGVNITFNNLHPARACKPKKVRN